MKKKQLLLSNKILTYYENLLDQKQEVLVFLHGWMQDGTSFSDICRELEEKNVPFISLDLPGFWWSQLLHDNMSIEEYGQVVIDFLEKLELTNSVLIWHSFGGRISIYLGSFYNNLSRIVLIGSAGIAPKMNSIKFAIVKTWKLIFSLPGLHFLWSKIKNKVSWEDYKNAGKMTQIFKNTISNDLQKYMKQVSLPTLLIWGKDDDQAPLEEWKIIKKHISGSFLQVLDWWHFIHQEKPKTLTEMILRFTHK